MAATQLSPTFKLVLLMVIGFTVLSFLTSVALAWAAESETSKQVLEMSLTTFKLGFGALVGLLGGKAV